MPDDLNLSLDPVRKKEKDRTPLIVGLLVVIAVMGAFNVLHIIRSAGSPSGDPAVLERLALKLEKQELYNAAAETWVEYLRAAAPEEEERARVWYRVGMMREQAGDCEEALAAYYRSEQTAALPELEHEISMAAERCLTRLSRFTALSSDIAERTSVGGQKEPVVLAEIGTMRITKDMLLARIEADVDAQVTQAAAGLPADEVDARREQVLDKVMKETDLSQWLERYVAEEMLFRYAMEKKIYDDPEVAGLSKRIERNLLTGQVLAKEYAGKVTVSDDEMMEWYRANGPKLAEEAGLGEGEVPPFEDVRDRVYAAVRAEKEMAVQNALLEKLREKYDVVIHSSRLQEEGKGREQ